MITALLRSWDNCVTSRSRMKYLPPRLLSRLGDADTVLDIGSFDGRLARHLLQQNPGISIVGVDIMMPANPAIPYVRYDGVRLPFADNSFDTVMLIDVLHHDEYPGRVLREAIRVTRNRILIKDHYWRNRWDHLILSVSDYLGNKLNEIPLPYNFLKPEEWEALFEELQVTVVAMEEFHYSFIDRCKQVVFSLETMKPDAAG